MERRRLGSTGTTVGVLALGTMTFGKETDEAEAHGQLDDFVVAGGDLVDTADVYQHGASEQIVGRWLASRGARDEVVLATKARFPMPPEAPNRSGLSRRWIVTACEDSLRRLGVDHVDLYQTHAWDPLTPVEETLAALDDLVTAGKVRHVGVSNVTGWQLQRELLLATDRARPVTLQPQYNLLAREVEWELVPLCADTGVGLLPWSPLGGGWLTGKYRRDQGPTGATRLGEDPERGVEAWDKRATDRTFRVVDEVVAQADARGVTPAQVALNWVRSQPTVSSVILGARSREQLADNLAAVDWTPDDDELARLDEVSAPPTPDYPYGFIEGAVRDRRAELG